MTYRGDKVAVSCTVALYALSRTKESPAEIAIVVPGGDEICRVEFPPGQPPESVEPGTWRVMIYQGEIVGPNIDRLAEMVRHTKTQATVALYLLVPGGAAGAAHHASGVQFWLPPGMGDPPIITATIVNWSLQTNHLATANDLLTKARSIAKRMSAYVHAKNAADLKPRLVEEIDEFQDDWVKRVEDFWFRSRHSL